MITANQRIGIGIGCILVIVLGLVTIVRSWRRAPVGMDIARDYFVDERKLESFALPSRSIPPLIAKDGQSTIVIAVYFSADNGKTRTLGYLKKYTPDAKKELDRAIAETSEDQPPVSAFIRLGHALLVRSPKPGSPWVPADSPEGSVIMTPPPQVGDRMYAPIMPN